jgi:hypothetical protein
MGLLEGGPNNTLHCRALDLIPQLLSYALHERIWIRQRNVPLTPEQSAALTAFALHADGKHIAFFRMLGQLTPLRSRGKHRTAYVGGPHGDHFSYFCSELVAESCVAASLLDPCTTRPAATYPRDLFFGCSRNPSLNEHLDLSAWTPPAHWTPCLGAQPYCRKRHPRLDGDTE